MWFKEYLCNDRCIIFFSVPSTIGSTLYFTNESEIDRLENKTITSVIEAEGPLEALDCNSCDDRIYWTNGEEIKRSFPNVSSSIEPVRDAYAHVHVHVYNPLVRIHYTYNNSDFVVYINCLYTCMIVHVHVCTDVLGKVSMFLVN